jgi:hypothetical protein
MSKAVSTVFFRITLGAFFVFLGLWGVLPNVDEGVFSLNNNVQWIEVVFGLVEMTCGAFLAASAFMSMRAKTMTAVTAVILVFWLLRIFMSKILWGVRINDSGIAFHPAFHIWILVLCCELLVASCLWLLLKALRD